MQVRGLILIFSTGLLADKTRKPCARRAPLRGTTKTIRNGAVAMKSILKTTIALSVLVLARTAPGYGENVQHPTCPKGYAPLGEICISALNGDIVLPGGAKSGVAGQTAEQTKTGR